MFEPNQILDIAFNQAPRQAMNAAFAIIRALLPTTAEKGALAQLVLGGGATGNAITSTITTPANREAWTDTGIVLSGTDALSIRASGSFRFSAGNPLIDINGEGGAYLYFCIVPDGGVPNGDVAGQFIYAEQRAIVGQIGRVFARIRDVGGASDNTGDVTLSLLHHADAATAFAQLSHSHNLSDVRGLEAALAAKASQEARLYIDFNAPAWTSRIKGNLLTLTDVEARCTQIIVTGNLAQAIAINVSDRYAVYIVENYSNKLLYFGTETYASVLAGNVKSVINSQETIIAVCNDITAGNYQFRGAFYGELATYGHGAFIYNDKVSLDSTSTLGWRTGVYSPFDTQLIRVSEGRVKVGSSGSGYGALDAEWLNVLPEVAPTDSDISPGQTRTWFDPTTNEIVTRGCKLSGAYWTRREAVVMD